MAGVRDILLQQLIRDGDLRLYHDYRARTIRDFSGQGNHGAFAGADPTWENDRLRFSGTSRVTVADDATLQGDTWSAVWWGEFDRDDAGDGVVVAKRDAGGTQFEIRMESTPQIDWYDSGGNTRSVAHDYKHNRCLAVTCEDGSPFDLYADGLAIGASGNNVSIMADDAEVNVGNDFNGANPSSNALQGVLLVARVLTSTEIARLYSEIVGAR